MLNIAYIKLTVKILENNFIVNKKIQNNDLNNDLIIELGQI